MIKTNQEKIVRFALQSHPDHPSSSSNGYWVGYDGKGRILPGVGGITYNFFVGDSCLGIAGDHIEPGVSSKAGVEGQNNAYNQLVCVGNQVTVISGKAEGKKGFVSGTHGGVEHVMLAFDADTLSKLTYHDEFLVEAYGQGLCLLDHPDIKVMSLDPELLQKMNIKENENGLDVGVTAIVPAFLMGSGLGSSQIISGDYDIMLHDEEAVKKYGLEHLRFGDLVYIEDHYCGNGPDYKKGAGSIGVIVHSDSYTSGHGPGVCIMMTALDGKITPFIDDKANLKYLMDFKK